MTVGKFSESFPKGLYKKENYILMILNVIFSREIKIRPFLIVPSKILLTASSLNTNWNVKSIEPIHSLNRLYPFV